MTDEQLAELLRLRGLAATGPYVVAQDDATWFLSTRDHPGVGDIAWSYRLDLPGDVASSVGGMHPIVGPTFAYLAAAANAVPGLVAEVRRLTALTMAVDLLQAENAALRAEVAKMAPLWHMHQTPLDGVTYTVHQSISSQEQP